MGLSESALKPFSCFKVIVRYHLIAHVVSHSVAKIIIVNAIWIHMNMLSVIAKKNT